MCLDLATYRPRYAFEEADPFKLSIIHTFCSTMRKELARATEEKKSIVLLSPKTQRINFLHSHFLLGCFAIQVLRLPLSEVCSELADANRYGQFCSKDPKDCGISLLEALEAVDMALRKGWCDFNTFDIKQHESLSFFDRGSISEVVPGEIYAIPSPITPSMNYMKISLFNPPEKMVEFLRPFNIKSIYRFNERLYEEKAFEAAGITVYDFPFPDGLTPPEAVSDAFLKTALADPHPKVMHCRAGMGRTGTMIGIYCWTKYKIPMAVMVAWMKIVRPGSVNERQLNFLIGYEKGIKAEPDVVQEALDNARPAVNIPPTPDTAQRSVSQPHANNKPAMTFVSKPLPPISMKFKDAPASSQPEPPNSEEAKTSPTTLNSPTSAKSPVNPPSSAHIASPHSAREAQSKAEAANPPSQLAFNPVVDISAHKAPPQGPIAPQRPLSSRPIHSNSHAIPRFFTPNYVETAHYPPAHPFVQSPRTLIPQHKEPVFTPYYSAVEYSPAQPQFVYRDASGGFEAPRAYAPSSLFHSTAGLRPEQAPTRNCNFVNHTEWKRG